MVVRAHPLTWPFLLLPTWPFLMLLLALSVGAAEAPGTEPAGALEDAEVIEPPPPPTRSVVTPVTEDGAEAPLPSDAWDAFFLVGVDVAPGDKRRLFLRASESFAGSAVDTPVLVARGKRAGPTLCVSAGVHGDELNGIEVVRSLFEKLTPKELSGMLVALPVVNLHGFRRSSRYLPDRRDLNRYFPGHPAGSSASRIAFAVFDAVLRHCDVLLDLHTGSFHRTNIPQIRADLTRPGLLELAKSFGVGIVVHSEGAPGTLRRAAMDAGIQALTFEAGEPLRFQREEIERGVQGIRNLMAQLGMLGAPRLLRRSPLVFMRTSWVRVDDGGIFITHRELGDRVRRGDVLGTVTDPISNERGEVLAPMSGRVIGMALSQVVIPGFAAFHMGIEAPTPEPEEPPLVSPDRLDPEEQPE